MENYLMLNGQKIELTDSQYKEIMNAIGDSAPSKKNLFERRDAEKYYLISNYGELDWTFDSRVDHDNLRYESANYCADKNLMVQRAFYEKVERNLWRFSMENGGSGNYYIRHDKIGNFWLWDRLTSYHNFGPTFVSREITERAINEVLIPMFEKENKCPVDLFKWKD